MHRRQSGIMLEEGEPETLVCQNPEGYVGLASQAHGPGFQVPHLLQLLELRKADCPKPPARRAKKNCSSCQHAAGSCTLQTNRKGCCLKLGSHGVVQEELGIISPKYPLTSLKKFQHDDKSRLRQTTSQLLPQSLPRLATGETMKMFMGPKYTSRNY